MCKSINWIKQVPFAHRGLYDEKFPENSIGAFKNAIQYGYGIELDVQHTKDKKIVVLHDENLKRMTGNSNNIKDLTYKEISELRLLDSNEKIPLLEEVLKVVNKKVPLMIEIKQHVEYENISSDVYNIVKNYEGLYCIQSFDPRIIMWYKENAKNVIRGQLSSKSIDILLKWYEILTLKNIILNLKTKPDYICYGLEGINCRRIKFLRKKMTIISWTIKNEKEMEKAYEYSDNIIFEGFRPKILKRVDK